MVQTRRGFILSALATALAGGVPDALAQGVKGASRASSPNFFELLTEHLLPQIDVLCLAVDDHADLTLNAPTINRNVWRQMAARGVTDFYLEFSREFDDRAKRLARGKFPRAVFVGQLLEERKAYIESLPDDMRKKVSDYADIKSYESLADQIIAAGAAGVTVHCIEPLSFRDSIDVGTALQTEPDKAIFVRRVEERLKYDGEIAEQIAMTRQGKAVVQFGAWHFLFKSEVPPLTPLFGRPDYNIDDNLRSRGIKTAIVHLTNEGGRIWNIMLQGLRDAPNLFRKVTGADTPDYEYAPKTDTVTRKSSPSAPVSPHIFNNIFKIPGLR